MDVILSLLQPQPSFAFAFTIAIIVYFFILTKQLISPIAKLPGPFLTKVSILPIVYHDHISNRTAWTHSLHQKYGPIVRLSPKEISICSPSSIRDVFTGSARSGYYSKAPMFNIFQHFGARNAFSSIKSEDHGWRRRIVAGNYALTAIVAKEAKSGNLWRRVGRFLDMIVREGVESEEVKMAFQIFGACRYFAADCVTSHLFLQGSDALGGDTEMRKVIEDSAEGPDDVLSYFKMEFEGFYSAVPWPGSFLGMKKNSGGRSRPATASGKTIDVGSTEWVGGTPIRDWGWRRFLDTKKAVAEGTLQPSTDGPVAAQLAYNAIQGDGVQISEQPAGPDPGIRTFTSQESSTTKRIYYRNEGCASECMDQLFAGVDTVGDTLAYVFHLLSLPENQEVQAVLREECASLRLQIDHNQPLSQESLTNILSAPWINAVIKETLRAYPASTTAFQRVVPSGGRVLDEYYVPEGIIVGGTPVRVNGDPSIFGHDVEDWRPARWVQASNVEEMNRRLWTFASGGRGCIGKHLAILEMKMLLAGVYSTYRTSVEKKIEVPRAKNHPGSRTTFRDICWFAEAKGVLRFEKISV